MKIINKIILIFCILFFGSVSSAKTNICEKVSENPVEGKFSVDCINAILINYVTYKPQGFFIIILSNEENIYVQGNKDSGNSFLFEAVGPSLTNTLDSKTVKSLLNLGWNFPNNSPNYEQIFQIDEIYSEEAAKLVFETLKSYNANPLKIFFEYSISDF